MEGGEPLWAMECCALPVGSYEAPWLVGAGEKCDGEQEYDTPVDDYEGSTATVTSKTACDRPHT